MKKQTHILFQIILSTLIVCTSQAQVSPKRGVAYGFHSQNDIAQTATGASWWYNWASEPDPDLRADYSIANYGVEFVPMVWNDNFVVADVIADIPADAKYLLAFNEPNFNVEANMSPTYAASQWYKVEQVADAAGLEIVGPAVAWCGGAVCNGSPEWWYDEFFANCPGCRVDFIAFHSYAPTPGDLLGELSIVRKYNIPIWLTEFADWNAANEAEQIQFAQDLINALETDPDIYRYSWFAGRSAHNIVSLLGADGVLTNLGTAYMNEAYGPVYAIPGRIEAENQYRRRGTGTEATTDVGGGENIGWTDPGTWSEYLVNINQTGTYNFVFRVASNVSTGDFDIYLDDTQIAGNITVTTTGGWQTWTDLNVNGLVLTGGEHLIRLVFNGAGTNINYFDVFYQGGAPATADFTADPTSACTGNTVTFTDASYNKSGTETYNWDFGAGATPATISGIGPHDVTYSTGGQKTVSLTVTNANGTDVATKNNYITVAAPPTGCIFSDDYNNGSVDFVTGGAFSSAESNSNWVLSNTGYDQWDYILYELNDGTNPVPLNFFCAANKPILKIRARATGNCLLRLGFMDVNGRSVDNIPDIDLELTTAYQTFTIDFEGHFENFNSGNPGILDSANIDRLQFFVNPGYVSFPVTGTNGTYNTAFAGDIEIDWIGIGDNCDAPPLPVELISLEAVPEGDHSRVKWSTATETNNDYFEVQRSTDGINFTTISTVPGQGNSSAQVDYTYEDFTPLTTLTYYRLKQVDFDASVTYSQIVSVSPVTGIGEFYVSPNPIQGNEFTITITTEDPNAVLEIYNMLGQLEYTQPLNKKETIINSTELTLAPGVYLAGLKNTTYRHKFIIR